MPFWEQPTPALADWECVGEAISLNGNRPAVNRAACLRRGARAELRRLAGCTVRAGGVARACRMHGARGGAPTGQRNGRYRHGARTQEATNAARLVAALRRFVTLTSWCLIDPRAFQGSRFRVAICRDCEGGGEATAWRRIERRADPCHGGRGPKEPVQRTVMLKPNTHAALVLLATSAAIDHTSAQSPPPPPASAFPSTSILKKKAAPPAASSIAGNWIGQLNQERGTGPYTFEISIAAKGVRRNIRTSIASASLHALGKSNPTSSSLKPSTRAERTKAVVARTARSLLHH
jgi:hypothetical protein